LRRWLFRVPLLLHRAGVRGLERVLGIDWIVVTTRGRVTGRPHTVVLDVIAHDAERDVYYVQPAYGGTADWVRNVASHPLVTAEVRGRAFPARATDVTGVEGAEAIVRFIREHPLYARLVVWFVGYVDRLDRPDDELRAALRDTVVVAIQPTDHPVP
jgi:deazaflavin-dependent oxidoreductase (nitroreductase family)